MKFYAGRAKRRWDTIIKIDIERSKLLRQAEWVDLCFEIVVFLSLHINKWLEIHYSSLVSYKTGPNVVN